MSTPSITFTLYGVEYDATATFDRIPLRDILRLEHETREVGRPMTWSEVRGLMQNLVDLGIAATAWEKNPVGDPPMTIDAHDDFPWFIALLVWGARTMRGEHISFGDAVDFPLNELVITVHEDGDGPDPHRARPGSGRAGAKRPTDRKPPKKRKTSASK